MIGWIQKASSRFLSFLTVDATYFRIKADFLSFANFQLFKSVRIQKRGGPRRNHPIDA